MSLSATTPSARNHRMCDRPASVPWWRQEAALVHEKQITATPAALEAQVARYGDSSLDVYIDGALLLWDLAHPAARTLSCAWWAEYDRADSSDRDQLAFARAVASTRTAGLLIISEGGAESCGVCHHYESNTTLMMTPKTLRGAPGPPCGTDNRQPAANTSRDSRPAVCYEGSQVPARGVTDSSSLASI